MIAENPMLLSTRRSDPFPLAGPVSRLTRGRRRGGERKKGS